jgi:hypothetical protein
MEPAGHSRRRDAERGRSVATKLTTKKSRDEKSAAKKATPKKASANGPAVSTGAKSEGGDLRSTLAPSQTATAIWGRIVKPDRANLTPEVARAILKLDFDPEDHRRVDELSAKARKGTLTPPGVGGARRVYPGGL